MTEVAKADAAESESDVLSPEEQKFFDARGEVEEKTEEKAEEKKAEEKPADEKVEARADDKETEEDGDEAEEVPLKEGEKGNQGRFVRHGAFHQERERRKALEKENAAFREREARLDERLKIINEAMAKTEEKPTVEEMPDPEKDVFGALNYALNKIKSLEGGLGETKKATEQTAQQNELLNSYRSDASRFAQTNPDFGEAYKYAMGARDKELEALGFSDPAQRAKLIGEEEQWIVTEALKSKQSPSERIYNFAKVKGFRPGNGEAKKQEEEKKPNGADAAQKLEKIQKGQEASKSLSGVGGGAGGELTAEALADMSQEEFDAFVEKTPKSIQKRLFGG